MFISTWGIAFYLLVTVALAGFAIAARLPPSGSATRVLLLLFVLGVGIIVGQPISDYLANGRNLGLTVETYKEVVGAFAAIGAACIAWSASQAQTWQGDRWRRDERDSVRDAVREETLVRIRSLVQMYAALRFRLERDCPVHFLEDLEAFLDEAVPAHTVGQTFVARGWLCVEKCRTEDRSNLVELVDSVERAIAALTATIDLARKLVKQGSGPAFERGLHYLRDHGLKVNLSHIEANFGDEEFASDVPDWIRATEEDIAAADDEAYPREAPSQSPSGPSGAAGAAGGG